MEDPCDENALCNNTDGSFVCDCQSGFVGNGFICAGKKGDILAIRDSSTRH